MGGNSKCNYIRGRQYHPLILATPQTGGMQPRGLEYLGTVSKCLQSQWIKPPLSTEQF